MKLSPLPFSVEASFDVDKLFENFTALMEAVKKAKPSGAKGSYVKKVTVTSTMGPGVKVDPLQAMNISQEK